MAIENFNQYYIRRFPYWADYLSRKLGDPEEAEDKVQEVFTRLLPRKEFCSRLLGEGKFDRYMQGVIDKQRAQVYREQSRRVPTTSIDPDNIDFLSSIRDNLQDDVAQINIELNDFYEGAGKLLENPRKLTSDCGFETVGELRQYIFIQYCRNGRTLREIGKLVGCSYQNIARRFTAILTILTPMISAFTGKGIKEIESLGIDLRRRD